MAAKDEYILIITDDNDKDRVKVHGFKSFDDLDRILGAFWGKTLEFDDGSFGSLITHKVQTADGEPVRVEFLGLL